MVNVNDDTSTNTTFLDSICTCKMCNHALTKYCINAKCTCCTEGNHSMILDGIEGFTPKETEKYV